MEPLSKHFTSCPKAFYRSIYHIKLKQQWTLKTYLWQNIFFKNKNIQSEKRWKVKLVLEHSSPPSPRLYCFPSYEVTRCITIPLWMGCQSITKLPPPPPPPLSNCYTWVERGTVRVSVLPMNWPGQVLNVHLSTWGPAH